MRVKRGNVARQRRKTILKQAKGFRGGLSKLFRPARQAVLNALRHAYTDRRIKKRDFRALWIVRLNAALQPFGLSYSKFIGQLNQANIQVNRKMLSEIAIHHSDAFEQLVQHVKG